LLDKSSAESAPSIPVEINAVLIIETKSTAEVDRAFQRWRILGDSSFVAPRLRLHHAYHPHFLCPAVAARRRIRRAPVWIFSGYRNVNFGALENERE
jgi:hypothetical protein